MHVDVERPAVGAATSWSARASAARRRSLTLERRAAVGRRCRCSVADVDRVVAARARRPAAVRRSTVTLRDPATRRPARHLAPPDRLPHVRLDTDAGRRTARASPSCVNDRPVFVKGVNWIPDDALPAPGRPGALRRAGSTQAAEANVNLLRVWGGGIYESRRLLRRVRRARPAGLAGLPVRLRRLPRGGAAARRGGRRGPRQRHPADAAPQPGAVERQQREHLGLRRLGLAGRGSPASTLGRGLLPRASCRRSSPSSTRPGRTAPAARGRSPPTCTPTTRSTAPCTSGTSGTSVDYPAYRDYVAAVRARSSAARGRRPGRRCAAPSSRRPADPGRRPGCWCTRRPTTATPSSTAGCVPHLPRARRHRRLALGEPAQPGPGRRSCGVEHFRSLSPRLHRQRSSGSSTTAGR